MDTKKIITESFFKKETYSEKRDRKMAPYMYAPVDPQAPAAGKAGFGAIISNDPHGFYPVTDAKEAQKRLISSFGAAVSSNTIKSKASRAIKSFPIIASSDIDPATVTMAKNLFEQQYASYISLLVSNQIVDISAFKPSEENGNIAIQALDSISGNDFGKQARANKAAETGEIGANDLFKNYSLYNLIRQEGQQLSCGDEFVDSLLEDAIIVPSENADDAISYLRENIEEVEEAMRLDEYGYRDGDSDENYRDNGNVSNLNISHAYTRGDHERDISLDQALQGISSGVGQKDMALGIITRNNNTNVINRQGNIIDTPNSRLTTSSIMVDPTRFQEATDRTVAEILTSKGNEFLRDRFEKACFLLNSNMISGGEFIDYCTKRLGIPVSTNVRRDLVTNFPTAEIRDLDDSNLALRQTKKGRNIANDIAHNRKISDPIIKTMTKTKVKDILIGTAAALGGGVVGGALGTAGTAIAAHAAGKTLGSYLGLSAMHGATIAFAGGPICWLAIGAAAVSGAIAGFLINLARKHHQKKINASKIEGWERVEALIDNMDGQRTDMYIKYLHNKEGDAQMFIRDKDGNGRLLNPNDFGFALKKDDDLDKEVALNSKDFINKYNEYSKSLNRDLEESADIAFSDIKATFPIDEEAASEFLREANEMLSDKEVRATLIEDSIINENIFDKLKDLRTKRITTSKNADKQVSIVPAYSAPSTYAYGSVEWDKDQSSHNQQRKYGEPLLMTIKFKERITSGQFEDAEMTAVIGILGKVITVPTKEMEYILRSNAEGKEAIRNIISGEGGNDIAIDMMGMSKIKKDVENLPQSSDLWNNLEKVSKLAVANRLAGKGSGNVANAHIIFSQKEVDAVKADTNVDYLTDKKLSESLLKKYGALTIMVANDVSERLYTMDDPDDPSWNAVPYSALRGKSDGDQLVSALTKMSKI